jgi:hypothetical protein
MNSDWATFFSAILGTTGVLLGLLFVGISSNVSKIISSKKLRTVAMQPMFLLLGLLINCIFFPVPEQSLSALGVEIIIVGLIFSVITSYLDRKVHLAYRAHITKSKKSQHKRYNSNIITNLLPFILIIASGIVLLIHGKSGIYLMVAAIVLAFIQTATMSWALLVIL